MKDITKDPRLGTLNMQAQVLEVEERFLEEVKQLHMGRKTRQLSGFRKLSPMLVSECSLQDASYRARYTEILAIYLAKSAPLRNNIVSLSTYLQIRYHDYLHDRFSTQKDRGLYIDWLLRKGQQKLNILDTVMEEVGLFIEDIDKASYALKHALDALGMIHGPKSTQL